jgi:23S rRNA (guanosine2251-2'-O)-methyltransferase
MGRNSIRKLRRPPRHSRPASPLLLENEDDLSELLDRTENPLVLVLEGVQDPHNLGACLRTAAGAGVTALIAPVKGSCGLTETVRDVSCGGADEVPFLKVKNLGRTLRGLRERGMHLVGTSDRGGGLLYEVDLAGPTAIVLGSEGWGLRKMTGDLCHDLVRIPMAGGVDCLNVSVSAGVCLYEAVRPRL